MSSAGMAVSPVLSAPGEPAPFTGVAGPGKPAARARGSRLGSLVAALGAGECPEWAFRPVPVSATLAANDVLASKQKAGEPVLPLAFGEAGLPAHPLLRDALAAAVGRNGYGPVAGLRPPATAAGPARRRCPDPGNRRPPSPAGPPARPAPGHPHRPPRPQPPRWHRRAARRRPSPRTPPPRPAHPGASPPPGDTGQGTASCGPGPQSPRTAPAHQPASPHHPPLGVATEPGRLPGRSAVAWRDSPPARRLVTILASAPSPSAECEPF